MSLVDWFKAITKTLGFFLPFLVQFPGRKIRAILHDRSYYAVPDPKNVVILGGSYAGVELAQQLCHRVPTGYKVILVEKNSHFNHVFNFPRYSVMTGEEDKAFLSYKGISKGFPEGIFEMIKDSVVEIHDDHVLLASGRTLDFVYLAIATGASQPVPSKMPSTEREAACSEMRNVQSSISESHKIAVIGGGAVGVELASDIKDFYPDKDVTIVHSHDRLMSKFGPKLSDHVQRRFEDELKIRVLVNERPKAPEAQARPGPASLTFLSGSTEQFDLVIPCTGQVPNSSALSYSHPDAISPSTGYILVRPTLQLLVSKINSHADHIFALGDVADHGGAHMARATWAQAHVVADNMMALIEGKQKVRAYEPYLFFEGAIKLTLGKTYAVMYQMDGKGDDVLLKLGAQRLDLGVDRTWSRYGVNYEKDRD